MTLPDTAAQKHLELACGRHLEKFRGAGLRNTTRSVEKKASVDNLVALRGRECDGSVDGNNFAHSSSDCNGTRGHCLGFVRVLRLCGRPKFEGNGLLTWQGKLQAPTPHLSFTVGFGGQTTKRNIFF